MYLCNDCYCRFTEFTTDEMGKLYALLVVV